MPTLALSATITLIVLDYIYKLLKLRLLTRFYQELLDKSNITYMIEEIIKSKYKNLAFFVPDNSRTGAIPKIMIFINNIKNK